MSRAIGERRAKELILSAKPFTVEQAKDWGLVNEIFPPTELVAQALKTAQQIAANAPVAVRQAKQAIHRGLGMSLDDGLAFEIEAYHCTIPTQDREEGILAFHEQRAPRFSGH